MIATAETCDPLIQYLQVIAIENLVILYERGTVMGIVPLSLNPAGQLGYYIQKVLYVLLPNRNSMLVFDNNTLLINYQQSIDKYIPLVIPINALMAQRI